MELQWRTIRRGNTLGSMLLAIRASNRYGDFGGSRPRLKLRGGYNKKLQISAIDPSDL
jgi:hypothetical protein